MLMSSKKTRLLLSFCAVCFGVLVLSISLISTNLALSSEGALATDRRLYFNEAILPDHLFYPVVAGADRLLLTLMPDEEKTRLQLAYSQIRLDYAWGLLHKGEQEMAASALSKSQKYINTVALAVIDRPQEYDSQFIHEVRQVLTFHLSQSDEVINRLNCPSRDLAIQLNDANHLLLDQLNQLSV